MKQEQRRHEWDKDNARLPTFAIGALTKTISVDGVASHFAGPR